MIWAALWWSHRSVIDPELCGTWVPVLQTSYASYDDIKTHQDLYLGFDGKLKDHQFGPYKRKTDNEDLPNDKISIQKKQRFIMISPSTYCDCLQMALPIFGMAKRII